MPPDTIERPSIALKDPSLLRQQCYVDGRWIDADDRGTMRIADPATGAPVGTAPLFHAAET
ncbi:MAG: succinate-semialdehyde dehydrogenase (NADP(+)), partial [Casimicrobiaceae bacterium]